MEKVICFYVKSVVVRTLNFLTGHPEFLLDINSHLSYYMYSD
jgi:hypothetical protein